ncbi:hypothetical protein KXR53_22190 [Inquilinus limosus]|uniref:hypothetical protein n=1 Tax=Inquilinus limosus TaxID=171674 RepID=UPI003F155277
MAVPPAAFVIAALGSPESLPRAVFSQEKIDHCMFIGDATDPVKRIDIGERMPNR